MSVVLTCDSWGEVCVHVRSCRRCYPTHSSIFPNASLHHWQVWMTDLRLQVPYHHPAALPSLLDSATGAASVIGTVCSAYYIQQTLSFSAKAWLRVSVTSRQKGETKPFLVRQTYFIDTATQSSYETLDPRSNGLPIKYIPPTDATSAPNNGHGGLATTSGRL